MTFRKSLFALFFSGLITAAAPLAMAAESALPVNINTADEAALAAGLKGVGEARARAIVAYRSEHGPFKTVEELTEVKGIGDVVIENNRANIVLK